MPLPRFYGCILQKAVDKLSWKPGSNWEDLTREQQGELTKAQVAKIAAKLNHKPLLYEHPEERYKVKIGEVTTNYSTEDDAWKVIIEVNDGTPSGKEMLRRIRNKELTGLSLSHDTRTLEPVDVCLVKEGFRFGTGIEGEMSIDSATEEEETMQSKPQEYIVGHSEPDTSSVFRASNILANTPRIIHAGLFAMSNQNQQPQQSKPFDMLSTLPPQQQQQHRQYNQYDNQNQSNQQQYQQMNNPQYPPQQQQQQQWQNTNLNPDPQQQPGGNQNQNQNQAHPPTQQQQQPQQPPQQQQQQPEGIHGDLKAVVDGIMRSNLPADQKKTQIDLLTKVAKQQSELMSEKQKAQQAAALIEAQLHNSKKHELEASRLFSQTVDHFIKQQGGQLPAPGTEDPNLIVNSPHTWLANRQPAMMAASARFVNHSFASSSSSNNNNNNQQQQHQYGQIQPPVSEYDPDMMSNYNAFQQVINENQQYAQNQPQMMYAGYGHQQQRQQQSSSSYGGHQQKPFWSASGLMADTVAVYRETNQASRGFGDTFSMSDVRSTPVRTQNAPSQGELDQMQGLN